MYVCGSRLSGSGPLVVSTRMYDSIFVVTATTLEQSPTGGVHVPLRGTEIHD